MPRMALPLATTARSCRRGLDEARPGSLRAADESRRTVPMRELLGDDAQPQTEADDAGEPDDAHQDRVPVEVALRDRRAGQVGRDAAAEHAGQAAALAPVQQDQQ